MQSDALLATCALSLMTSRSRREWRRVLESLRVMDVTWPDVVHASQADAWKLLSWDAAAFREWNSSMELARTKLSDCRSDQISVVTVLDDCVPGWLTRIENVPWVFYRGDISLLDRNSLGFSGQREPGEDALTITRALASEAARQNFIVVSGGARGIDMAAHTSALDSGGATAVLLPQGLAIWRRPYALARGQVADRVLVMSEDAPWENWSTESAMRRNRMIVNLSHVFTVPQSGLTGGSHSTGMYAIRRNRVTYVPDLGDEYPGNSHLLQSGATPLHLLDGRPDLEDMMAESESNTKPTQSTLF